jgi:hypothetical protein
VAIPGALFGCATASVVMIGALSLLAESRARHVLESWINIHALFALMLFALLLARHQSCVNRSMPLLPADIRVLSRQLSRASRRARCATKIPSSISRFASSNDFTP